MFDYVLPIFNKPTRQLAIPLALMAIVPGCRNKSDEPAPAIVPEKPALAASVAPAVSSAKPENVKPAPAAVVRFAADKFMIGMSGNTAGEDYRDMQPMHQVEVPAFLMDVNEITVAAYRACVQAGACTDADLTSNPKREELNECNWGQAGYEDDPINCVSWDQAAAYCKWVGKELPTEEMWEYAAGGPKKRDFPWGMAVAGQMWGMPAAEEDYVGSWCDSAAREKKPARVWRRTSSCPIASRPKSNTPEGLADMATNVSEWTASVFCPYDKPKCDSRQRVIRGGHTGDHKFNYRVVVRSGEDPTGRSDFIGFRCAQREGG